MQEARGEEEIALEEALEVKVVIILGKEMLQKKA